MHAAFFIVFNMEDINVMREPFVILQLAFATDRFLITMRHSL